MGMNPLFIEVLVTGLGIILSILMPFRLTFGASTALVLLIDILGILLCIADIFETKERSKKSQIPKSEWILPIMIGVPFVSLFYRSEFQTPEWIFCLPKLVCFLHLFEVRRLVDRFDSMHPIVARILPLLVVVPIIIHIIACLWTILGNKTSGPFDQQAYEYIRSVYWVITTLSTVGYGDITPSSVPQMLLACITMIIGVGFFGYVLSNVASLLSRLDAAKIKQNELLDRTEFFLSYNRVPQELRIKARSFFRYVWENRQGYDDMDVLSHFPKGLQAEILVSLHWDLIQKVPILKGAEASVLHDVVMQMMPAIAMPGEVIFYEGEAGDSMYFIRKGDVQIIGKDDVVLATLSEGSFFGETALLNSKPRNASAKAVNFSEIMILSRKGFENVLKRHQHFAQHVHEVVQARNNKPIAS